MRLAFLVLSVGWFFYYVNRLLPVVAAFLGRHVFRPAAGLLALVPGLIVLVLLSRAFTYLDQGRCGAGVQPR